MIDVDATARCEFEHAIVALIERHGGTRSADLATRVRACVDQILEALSETAEDGESLSQLDVARIRLGKFAATRLPPAVFRDARALAALRAEILGLLSTFLGASAAMGTRFGATRKS